ncbi:hypothetical protein [Thermoanaerobacter sp. RKWS2]|uniref:hypothetical protein n=1 Tax=Thermoanaerobacter sp. RKWS2 TaxID=2983842 RepID=UPI00224B4A36|nr:hypothetical protein [Thermoanaerobacter sp. RKWS2]UZQ81898.1 hypothetical protein OEI98_001639 [Thermoanaerobacter sp. RKWS2]
MFKILDERGMKMLPKECSKCLKKDGNVCTAFNNPYFQWRNGRRCYGYVDSPAEMLKMYQEMCHGPYA